MSRRITAAKLQRLLRVLQPLIAAVHDARTRFADARHLRPRHLSGLSRFVKDVLSLPHTADLDLFEPVLKRRLVRVQHRLLGHATGEGALPYSLARDLPTVYLPKVRAYEEVAGDLLCALADVPLSRVPLKSVRDLRSEALPVCRVVFVSRADAARYAPGPESVLISINNPDEALLEPQPGWREVLFLRMHDVDTPAPGLQVFSTEQAQQVLALVSRHRKTAQEFVLHCQAGMSRSGGMAVFLSEYLGVPCFKAQAPVTGLSWPLYNRKVYRTMAQAAHGPVGSAFACSIPRVGFE